MQGFREHQRELLPPVRVEPRKIKIKPDDNIYVLLREQRFALCFFETGQRPRFFVFGLRDNYIK